MENEAMGNGPDNKEELVTYEWHRKMEESKVNDDSNTNIASTIEMTESQDSSGPKITLSPDHPLLAKFQQALKEQLERQITKLSMEVTELNSSIKNKIQDRDDVGHKVYEAQQIISKQQETVENYEDEIRKFAKDRDELEEELTKIRTLHNEKRLELSQAEAKDLELQNEVETINYMMKQMLDWEEKLHSELRVNQRIAEKSQKDKKLYSEEKRNLDFTIYKLMTEIFRMETSLEQLDVQLLVKDQEREDLAQLVVNANADLEELQSEHRRLMHSWNSVLVSIEQRDKSYLLARTELRKTQEKLQTTLTEINVVKKACNDEMSRNEQLTLIKGRIEVDTANTTTRLLHEKERLATLDHGMEVNQSMINQTSKDLQDITYGNKFKENEINNLQREIEKQTALKIDLEEKILTMLQEQITSDKVSKYMNKKIKEEREKNRELEITLASVENHNADVLVAIEKQKAANKDLQRDIDELNKEQLQKESDVNALMTQLHNTKFEIARKQRNVDNLNKKLEEQLQKTGGIEMSPQEIRIKALEKQISEGQEKNKTLQTFWLRQQCYIVSMADRRRKQLNDLNLVRKQAMILEQKKMKYEDELEELKKQERVIIRGIMNLQNKLDKVSEEIYLKQGYKYELDKNTILMQNDYVNQLKENEMECIKLENEISDLEEEKQCLSKDLIEKNREALAWERKIQMASETKKSIEQEKSAEGEMGAMRSEIHRMTVRQSQLKKVQDKLIQDLQHCVSRRDSIWYNAEAAEKRLLSGAEIKNRALHKRKLEDIRIKIKKTENEKKALEEKIADSYTKENEIMEDIKQTQNDIEKTNKSLRDIEKEINLAKLNKQMDLDSLVFKQHKAKSYSSILKGHYKMLYRSSSAANQEFQKQTSINNNLQTVVEALYIDFPIIQNSFAKILNTLRLPTQ